MLSNLKLDSLFQSDVYEFKVIYKYLTKKETTTRVKGPPTEWEKKITATPQTED